MIKGLSLNRLVGIGRQKIRKWKLRTYKSYSVGLDTKTSLLFVKIIILECLKFNASIMSKGLTYSTFLKKIII